MKMLVLGLSLTLVSASSLAQEVQQNCLGIAGGVKSEYMADTGDVKGATLIAQNARCGKPRRGGYRWRQLSLQYRALNQAIASGNVDEIAAAAQSLRVIAYHRSSMFTSCWKTMLSNGKLVESSVNGAVATLAGPVCVKP
jgi:hypothetical protein